MSEQTYVLVWSIDGGRYRGAFCPARGLTREEATQAKYRLLERAEVAGIRQLGRPGRGPTIHVVVVPYVFDIASDSIRGLSEPE
jgi:hypothetical protein